MFNSYYYHNIPEYVVENKFQYDDKESRDHITNDLLMELDEIFDTSNESLIYHKDTKYFPEIMDTDDMEYEKSLPLKRHKLSIILMHFKTRRRANYEWYKNLMVDLQCQHEKSKKMFSNIYFNRIVLYEIEKYFMQKKDLSCYNQELECLKIIQKKDFIAKKFYEKTRHLIFISKFTEDKGFYDWNLQHYTIICLNNEDRLKIYKDYMSRLDYLEEEILLDHEALDKAFLTYFIQMDFNLVYNLCFRLSMDSILKHSYLLPIMCKNHLQRQGHNKELRRLLKEINENFYNSINYMPTFNFELKHTLLEDNLDILIGSNSLDFVEEFIQLILSNDYTIGNFVNLKKILSNLLDYQPSVMRMLKIGGFYLLAGEIRKRNRLMKHIFDNNYEIKAQNLF